MDNRSIVYISLFAALTAALGLIPPIPLASGVPISVQSLAPMLAGSILGAKRGALSQILFLILVAAGLPLLSGGRGGIGVFMSPTGGFAIGWVAAAFTIGGLVELFWQKLSVPKAIIFNFIGGVFIIYLIGIPWLMFVLNLSVMQAIVSSLPFLPGDLVKVVLAAVIAVTIKKSYPVIRK